MGNKNLKLFPNNLDGKPQFKIKNDKLIFRFLSTFRFPTYIAFMKEMKFSKFSAKLLLFGEYLVIHGYEALAAPIKNYGGKLEILDEESDVNVAPFVQYLGALPNIILDQDLIDEFPLGKLIFKSDIPVGYGAGSSGALTAAIYEAFVLNKKENLSELKDDLATMEDFFHGSSSGIDPLISFTNQNIRLEKNDFSVVSNSDNIAKSMCSFFLLDTGKPRKTGPLVEIFKMKMEDEIFASACENELRPLNSDAIKSFINHQMDDLNIAMSKISKFQYHYFFEMIPPRFVAIWKEILEDDKINIKLCGAGGGGFLLLFSRDKRYTKDWLKTRNLKLIEIEV